MRTGAVQLCIDCYRTDLVNALTQANFMMCLLFSARLKSYPGHLSFDPWRWTDCVPEPVPSFPCYHSPLHIAGVYSITVNGFLLHIHQFQQFVGDPQSTVLTSPQMTPKYNHLMNMRRDDTNGRNRQILKQCYECWMKGAVFTDTTAVFALKCSYVSWPKCHLPCLSSHVKTTPVHQSLTSTLIQFISWV